MRRHAACLLAVLATTVAQADPLDRLPAPMRQQLDALALRIRSPERVDLEQALRACCLSELPTIVGASDPSIAHAAYSLLSDGAATLDAGQRARLLEIVIAPGGPSWRRKRPAELLAAGAAGCDQLAPALDRGADEVRIAVAASLVGRSSVAPPALRHTATERLLALLASRSEDDANEAYNGLASVATWEPWITAALVARLGAGAAPGELGRVLELLSASGVRAHADAAALDATIRTLTRHPDGAVRAQAIRAVAAWRRADDALVKKLARDPDPLVRAALWQSLEHAPSAIAGPRLLAGLDDPVEENRRRCVESLSALKYAPAVRTLVERVRRSVAAAKIDRAAGEAVVAIVGLAEATYDFRSIAEHRPIEGGYVWVVQDREGVYAQSAERLLRWWQAEGRKKFRG